METAAQEILTDKTINPVFQRAYNVRGWVNTRAYEIKHEMALGERKPFDEVVIHYGDPHAFGQSPITFVRQCLACLLCPQFLNDPQFPKDVKEKARRILKATPGFAISRYTSPLGSQIIREDVARYISRRDGYPADVDDVILINGGAIGIQIGLASLGTDMPNGKLKPGLMIPIPGFPQYNSRIVEFNLYEIPYYLEEENNWSFNIGEMKKAIDEARPHCEPRGLVLINPGNPTAHFLTLASSIAFCGRRILGKAYKAPITSLHVTPSKEFNIAVRNNLNPDGFYCWQLMETTGIVPTPGENYGQKEGTYHFRLTILPSEEKIAPMYERLSKFHKEFMDKYKDNKEN
ncbi:alanine aminotransferase 2-like [Pocillopora damicornis]|uniref:alanine aminotransferase 2-like n=1 Tax=Pocillopora damicornis TaxID=46731 RepID=UPI000F55991B|nr:alanine aminotransferase 2-like [Pocillopora damicornis]